MEQIIIREASINNLSALQDIGRNTFEETFAQSNDPADMQAYLDEKFSEPQLRTELENPDSHFFIAWQQDTAVGYLKVNFGAAQTEQQPNSMEIERIYVLGAYHGKQVGQLLYETALETARKHGVALIWLGVWEKNPRAIRFYEKNGFRAFGSHPFRLGDDIQTDIMMRKIVSEQ